MNTRSVKSSLTKALKKGVMSPLLRTAIEATLKALDTKNLKLAYHITACKSLITSNLDPKDKVHAFQEDGDANEEALGNSLYSILDGVHFQLANVLQRIPSGMMIMYARGIHEMTSKGTHPIIKRIIAERKAIHDNVRR
jgi:hypothetical protein